MREVAAADHIMLLAHHFLLEDLAVVDLVDVVVVQ
jgi:hypothetical protein